jgi:hypothetical protein
MVNWPFSKCSQIFVVLYWLISISLVMSVVQIFRNMGSLGKRNMLDPCPEFTILWKAARYTMLVNFLYTYTH